MISLPRAAASVILGGLAWAVVAGPGIAVPQAKDATDLIPNRKHMPLKGRVVGVLLYDGQPVLSTEGRSGPRSLRTPGARRASSGGKSKS